MRLAIQDLEADHGEAYAGERYLAQLTSLAAAKPLDEAAITALQREALLANPALDFEEILLIRRGFSAKEARKGTSGNHLCVPPINAHTMFEIKRKGWDNEIVKLVDFRTQPRLKPVFKGPDGRPLGEMDLHFDAGKLMFSMIHPESGVWRLWELDLKDGALNQLTPDDGDDIDHFDSCYLPDGRIIFTSTASFLGMPCIHGRPRMATTYLLDPKDKSIRQLGFDQDSNYCPTVMNNGRVMYLRWEYTDMVHSNNRVLMTMDPDGTGQRGYWGSNSYFPAAFHYARPIPGHPGAVVGIAGGHHGPSRQGRMLVVDPQLGTREGEGVTHQLPGRGTRVDPVATDPYSWNLWPRSLHPWPLAQSGTHKGAGKYFLVSMKLSPDSLWGIYLVDIFDNAVLIHEAEEQILVEPVPLRPVPTPPVIADGVDPDTDTASVYIQDVHLGPGLAGVPKGVIKKLRVGTWGFSVHGLGGHNGTLGVDSSWDYRTLLGTVPVHPDGSTSFTIPANTPIFLQPLDAEGRAVQNKRSWFVGMPGERVSCIGCHEDVHQAPTPTLSQALSQKPFEIEDITGSGQPFSYPHQVEPIVQANCASCHTGDEAVEPVLSTELLKDWQNRLGGANRHAWHEGGWGGKFSLSYAELVRYVRRPGLESDMGVLVPREFGANTTELVQMLKKGHHGVELTNQEWQTLYRWIDFNSPYYGYRRQLVDGWKGEATVLASMERANELAKCYSDRPFFDLEQEVPPVPVVKPKPKPDQQTQLAKRSAGTLPFKVHIDKERRDPIQLDLGGGQKLTLNWIPPGEFVMGSAHGALDELPMHPVRLEKGFWMAATETTNAQFRQFDPEHHSRSEDRHGYQFGVRGYDVNRDELPAVRVSWQRAHAYTEWLSEKTGLQVRLPNEAQWEWACRAGSATPFSFGQADQFGAHANLADVQMEKFAEDTTGFSHKGASRYTGTFYLKNPSRYEMWIPHVKEVDDGQQLQTTPGSYQPNAWGLHDMHGNVAEWTRSLYQDYPVHAETDPADPHAQRVVRGGSFYDRPHRATSSHRLAYPGWQQVYNVGLRLIVEP